MLIDAELRWLLLLQDFQGGLGIWSSLFWIDSQGCTQSTSTNLKTQQVSETSQLGIRGSSFQAMWLLLLAKPCNSSSFQKMKKKKKLHVERSSYIWKLYYEKFFFYSKCSMIFMEQKFTRGFSYDSDKQSFTATFWAKSSQVIFPKDEKGRIKISAPPITRHTGRGSG